MARLLDGVGEQLKPKVLCLSDLSNTGAGQPDFGLYAANQVQKGKPRKGQAPERGVIEMKSVKEAAWLRVYHRSRCLLLSGLMATLIATYLGYCQI
jgi:hypothetical protein